MFMDFQVVFQGEIQTDYRQKKKKEAKTFDVSWL